MLWVRHETCATVRRATDDPDAARWIAAFAVYGIECDYREDQ